MLVLRIALNNLLASRRRTLFLGIALFLVTMFFMLLLALTAGVTDNLIRASTTISSGHVNIGGYYKATPTDSQTVVLGVSKLRKEAKEILGNDAVRIVDRMRGWGKIISEKGTVQSGINGIDIDEEAALFDVLALAPAKDYIENPPDPELTKGSFADLKRDNTIMLFAGQAKRLKVDVGDQITIRTETLKGQSNTAEATVVAIVRDLGLLSSFASFSPKSLVVELYQFKPDVSGAVQIYLDDIRKSTDAMNRLRRGFAERGYAQLEHDGQPFFIKLLQTVPQEDWTGAKLDVTTWEDESSFLVKIIAGLRGVSLALVMLLAIVIVVGITNTMTIAVRERTREIGTLRAIGMNRGSILFMFFVEATVLGLLASGFGAVVGVAVAAGLDAATIRVDVDAMRVVLLSDTLHLVPRAVDAIVAVVTLTAVSAAAALWPALRAARVSPVTAMQSVD